MKCPKCGKEIANDSLFCEYCGTKLSKPNSKIGLLLIAMGALVLLISHVFQLVDYNIVQFIGLGLITVGSITAIDNTNNRT